MMERCRQCESRIVPALISDPTLIRRFAPPSPAGRRERRIGVKIKSISNSALTVDLLATGHRACIVKSQTALIIGR